MKIKTILKAGKGKQLQAPKFFCLWKNTSVLEESWLQIPCYTNMVYLMNSVQQFYEMFRKHHCLPVYCKWILSKLKGNTTTLHWHYILSPWQYYNCLIRSARHPDVKTTSSGNEICIFLGIQILIWGSYISKFKSIRWLTLSSIVYLDSVNHLCPGRGFDWTDITLEVLHQ